MAYESRIHKIVRENAERAAQQDNNDELEADLEASERRALRLAKELLDETTMRIRAENFRTDLEEQIEDLTTQIADMEMKLDERIGKPKRIRSKRSQPVDSSEAEEENSTAAASTQPSVHKSSRVRGGVK